MDRSALRSPLKKVGAGVPVNNYGFTSATEAEASFTALYKEHNFMNQLMDFGQPAISEWTFSIYISSSGGVTGDYIDFGSPRYEDTAGESKGATFEIRDTFGLTQTSKWITSSEVDGLAFISAAGTGVYALGNKYPIHFNPGLAGLEIPSLAMDEFAYLLMENDKYKQVAYEGGKLKFASSSCDPFSLPSLFFRIDQKYIELHPLDYLAFNSQGQCSFALETTTRDYWTFGSMALNYMYTIYRHYEGAEPDTVTLIPTLVDGEQMKTEV